MKSQELCPRIIFEDNHFLVLSKPAGLLSQGEERGQPNLVDWLRGYLDRHYVGLIHRLDRNVSGLMVVAKRSKSAARLTLALQEGKINRKYQGWILGRLKEPQKWQHFLMKDEKKNQVKVVTAQNRKGKEAVLSVRPLGYGHWQDQTVTLAEFELETGRSHQIRIQSAFEGYPLLGDIKYGKEVKDKQKFHRPALHSAFLSFPHPISGELLLFEDALPEDMAAIRVTA